MFSGAKSFTEWGFYTGRALSQWYLRPHLQLILLGTTRHSAGFLSFERRGNGLWLRAGFLLISYYKCGCISLWVRCVAEFQALVLRENVYVESGQGSFLGSGQAHPALYSVKDSYFSGARLLQMVQSFDAWLLGPNTSIHLLCNRFFWN